MWMIIVHIFFNSFDHPEIQTYSHRINNLAENNNNLESSHPSPPVASEVLKLERSCRSNSPSPTAPQNTNTSAPVTLRPSDNHHQQYIPLNDCTEFSRSTQPLTHVQASFFNSFFALFLTIPRQKLYFTNTLIWRNGSWLLNRAKIRRRNAPSTEWQWFRRASTGMLPSLLDAMPTPTKHANLA